MRMMQTLELFRDGAPTIEDNHAHHHHIHFTRNHTSTLKSLLQQGSMSTTTSPSSSTYSKPPSPLLLNKTPTGKNKEFCAVEVDIMGLTGASPVIRSLPSTFGNANQPKMKWKECLQLEKLNKKFQRKLNEFEEVVVIFFNMKQQR